MSASRGRNCIHFRTSEIKRLLDNSSQRGAVVHDYFLGHDVYLLMHPPCTREISLKM